MSGRPRPSRDQRQRRVSNDSTTGARMAALAASLGENRAKAVILAFFLLAAVFLLRLFYLQVIVSDSYSAKAEESRTVSFETTPRRGTIYDRNGVVLAMSVDATTIYCNPVEVTDVKYEASQIASVIGGEAADYEKKLSQDSTTFAYLKRQATVEEGDRLKELKLAGVYFIADTRREYPNGAVGGQVIGYCNVDGAGITGLELQYDDILRGTPGTYSAERGEGGIPIPGGVHEDVAAVDGEDIMISLDIKLQDSVEKALAAGVSQPQVGAEKGSSVVMDAGTGEIYAICSLPYMDPTNMGESEVGSENLAPVTTAFEPGSIFKTVSAMTVLEAGAMTPDDEVFCPSFIQADEYEISDAHARGDMTMTFREILNVSSNVGISLSIGKVGFQALNDAILRYNLNEATGVDYPGEAPGYMLDFDDWARITGYNVSFGQGISVTPLQMTRFYGAIANGGVEVTPHFLISLPQKGERPTYGEERVIGSDQALGQIRSMLRTVVEQGTGKDADIAGYDVVGKTSTAEIAENGRYVLGKYNLCFTGFIDNSSSQLVCFVSANDVYSEASVAFVFHDIMTNAIDQYNIVPR